MARRKGDEGAGNSTAKDPSRATRRGVGVEAGTDLEAVA